jgi:hypothetical protein
MKNFNLFSGVYARKLIGFLLVLGLDFIIFDSFNTDFKMFLFLLLNGFLFYYVMEFSSYGSNEYISIDFRTEQEQERDIIKNRKKLIEGSINNLLVEASMGNISDSEVDRRLKTIEKIYSHLNTLELPSGEHNFLELPKNADYV